MSPLIIPLYPQSTAWSITIDGVTYRPPLVDSSGRLKVSLDIGDAGDYRHAHSSQAGAATDQLLIAAPGAGLRIYVLGVVFSTAVALNVKLTQSAAGGADVWGPHYFPANGGISLPPVRPVAILNTNSALRYTTSGAGAHTIDLQAVVA